MPERAKVTSIDAIAAFRTSLILYLEKAARILDEISDDVTRTRLWLDNDRRLFWEKEVRRRTKNLEDKQQELFAARLSELKEVASLEQAAVRKARQALDAADARLATVKQWRRQYDDRVMPLAREVDKLREVLDHDMRKAAALLAETVKTLDAYAGLAPPDLSAARTPPEQSGESTDLPERNA